MAAIDYGALLRVNGEFINKDGDLFMDKSDKGYVLKKATYADKSIWDEEIGIDGNFYVYAGDEALLLVFYRGYFYVISNGLIIRSIAYVEFIAEEFYLDGLSIKVSHLEPELYIEKRKIETWKEFVKDHWIGATGNEKLCELEKGALEYKRYIKRIKKARRDKGYGYRRGRWLAEWEHNGDKYEVIFGYGIDPKEDVWNDIKNDSHDFTKREIDIIDRWFSK